MLSDAWSYSHYLACGGGKKWWGPVGGPQVSENTLEGTVGPRPFFFFYFHVLAMTQWFGPWTKMSPTLNPNKPFCFYKSMALGVCVC